MVSAAIYTRISDDRDGQGLGVARQEADCRAVAAQRGWDVADIYVDNDTGAWSKKPRPSYRRMLDDIKAGAVDAVIVYNIDRLTRRPVELEEFFEVCDRSGIRNLACVSGDIDLGSHEGQFTARILGAVARKESDDKSRRTRRKHLELAERGMPVGGGRPFGYENDRVTVIETEAALIREAAGRVLAGDSVRSIATDWRARGVLSPRGNPWSPVSLRKVLINRRYAGLRTIGQNGPVAAKGQWPPILDQITHERVRVLLLSPNRVSAGGRTRSYLLTGFLACGLCGERLIAQPRTDRSRSYCCSSSPGRRGCGRLRIVAEPLEAEVTDQLMAVVDNPPLAAARARRHSPAAPVEDLVAQLARDGEALEQAGRDHYVNGIIDRATFLATHADLTARQETTRARLARREQESAAVAHRVEPGAVLAAWATMSLDQKRALIGTWIEVVTIRPRRAPGWNKWDPERVTVTWRS